MQEFLPIIKTTLLEWAQLTLVNPLYATAVAIAAFVLSAIVCSVTRIPLKRKAAALETANIQLAYDFELAQQGAAALQDQLTQRDQQLAGTLQALSARFDLGLSKGEAPQADDLWQQHDRVIAELATRLHSEQQAKVELRQAYQTETGKLAEKEVLLESLQNTLTEKTRQIAGLEQQIGQIVEKHALESARLAELEQQTLEWLHTRQQLEALEEKLNAKESEFSQLQSRLEAQKQADVAPPQSHQEAAKEPKSIPPQISAEVAEIEEQHPHATITLGDWESEPETATSEPEAKPANAASESGGVAALFKNLFGKSKQEPAASAEAAPEEAPPVTAEIPHEAVADEQPSVSFAQSQLVKIKSLLGLSKQEAATVEAEEPVLAEAAEPETAEAGEPSAGIAKSQLGKIKNLFGMSK